MGCAWNYCLNVFQNILELWLVLAIAFLVIVTYTWHNVLFSKGVIFAQWVRDAILIKCYKHTIGDIFETLWYIWENKKILYIEFEKKNEFLSHLELLPFNCWNQKGRGRWRGRGHQLAWGVASNFTRLTIIYTIAKFSQVLPYSICYKYFNVPTVARQLLTIGL